jgi:oligopeptide/dipeptide ABC transporter ATP-binding protein
VTRLAEATVVAPPILETDGLTKHFEGSGLFRKKPAVRAVDGVSLSVRTGERLAIVGESGCGKTTLGRLMLRLIEPSAGDVRFLGESLIGLTETAMRARRRDMQIVFQDPYAALNPRMTVGALLAEPVRLHRLAEGKAVEERVAELLRLVGLLPVHAERYPHEFSGGQRQRIAIARALASEPKLLVGDEPVSALDVSIQAQIVNLLEDLGERLGFTLLLIAHDLAVIRHVSDRVAVMYLGEVVELAAADALFENPLHPYTRALIEAAPIAEPGARRARRLLEGDPPSPTAPPSGCRFHTRCPHARALCKEERPPLTPATDGRVVACHFWAEIAAAGAGAPRPLQPAPKRTERIALFAEAVKKRSAPAAAKENGHEV